MHIPTHTHTPRHSSGLPLDPKLRIAQVPCTCKVPVTHSLALHALQHAQSPVSCSQQHTLLSMRPAPSSTFLAPSAPSPACPAPQSPEEHWLATSVVNGLVSGAMDGSSM